MAETAEKNLVDTPLYTPLDVARYLRAPVWLVIGAWRGRFPPHPEMIFHWFDGRRPQFDLDGDLSDLPELRERWSFRQLADLYVRFFAVESLLELSRSELAENKKHRLVGEAVSRVLRCDIPVPIFFGAASPEEGVSQVLELCSSTLQADELGWLEKKLRLCLERFDLEGSVVSRLYPFSRTPVEGSPRVIVMDPEIRFGRPTVAGHGTPTDILLERHQAGDSIADLAEDYGIPAQEIEEAVRYEAKPCSCLLPFFCW